MNKLIFFLLILTTSCSSDKATHLSFRELYNQLQENKQVINYNIDRELFNIDSLKVSKNSQSIIYVMNATCSICIYQFIDFYYKNLQFITCPIVVVVENDLKPQVEYFFEKAKIEIDSKNLILIDNSNKKIVKGDIDNLDLNGLVILQKNNKIEDSFLYIGQSDFFEEL